MPKLTFIAGGSDAKQLPRRRPLAPRIDCGDVGFVFLANLWNEAGITPEKVAATRRHLLEKWGYRYLESVTDELAEAVELLREAS